MCGIVGKITPSAPEEVLEILRHGYKALEHRGNDSYGIALYTGKNFLFAKAIYLEEFLDKLEEEVESRKIKSVKWFIAHNRQRSTGKIDIDTAHPVWDTEGKLFVIQNGTKKEFYSILPEAKSDTHGILLFYKNVKQDFLLKLLQGTGVVFIFDPTQKKILFHRDEERTLFVNHEGLIASEPITQSKWALIKEQNTVFHAEEGLRFKTHEWKEIDVVCEGVKTYCGACATSKYITVHGKRQCPACFYLGKKAESSIPLYGGPL